MEPTPFVSNNQSFDQLKNSFISKYYLDKNLAEFMNVCWFVDNRKILKTLLIKIQEIKDNNERNNALENLRSLIKSIYSYFEIIKNEEKIGSKGNFDKYQKEALETFDLNRRNLHQGVATCLSSILNILKKFNIDTSYFDKKLGIIPQPSTQAIKSSLIKSSLEDEDLPPLDWDEFFESSSRLSETSYQIEIGQIASWLMEMYQEYKRLYRPPSLE